MRESDERHQIRRRHHVTTRTTSEEDVATNSNKPTLQGIWDEAAKGMTSEEVDAAWVQLLEETLPPEKHKTLMSTYEAESDPKKRYFMLLEFSSYLRQVLHLLQSVGERRAQHVAPHMTSVTLLLLRNVGISR